MSWEELEQKPKAKKAPDDDRIIALKQAANRAFARPDQLHLREELERLVRRPSYAPGRTAEDVAYLEGCRRVALDLLKLGGVYE